MEKRLVSSFAIRYDRATAVEATFRRGLLRSQPRSEKMYDLVSTLLYSLPKLKAREGPNKVK